MYYKIKKSSSAKKNIKRAKKKMNLTTAIRENTNSQNLEAYPKALSFFPLPDGDHLCRNINKNLFQLEKDLAYFSFAIKEIKDIF